MILGSAAVTIAIAIDFCIACLVGIEDSLTRDLALDRLADREIRLDVSLDGETFGDRIPRAVSQDELAFDLQTDSETSPILPINNPMSAT